MKTELENPQAFPRNGHPDRGDFPTGGMTLRDYFAAKAANGICSSADENETYTVNGGYHHPETIAKVSYQIADAMLKERLK